MKSCYKPQFLTLLFMMLMTLSVDASTPRIVVSIKPLHSLVLQLTAGVSEPQLLLDQQQSPHHFQLRPSQQRMLERADLFIYSSESIEGYVKRLKDASPHLTFIEASALNGIHPLKTRMLDDHHAHHADEVDGHIWLSIENTKVIVQQITTQLIKRDPEHQQAYKNNLASLVTQLDKLKSENQQLLSNHREQAFMVYHDALQYFEVENQLSGAHFITTTPEFTPGIKRIKTLKKQIHDQKIRCIFYEPPGIPPMLKTLIEESNAKLAAIDPAGTQIPAGPGQYFQLMQQMASTLHECLAGP